MQLFKKNFQIRFLPFLLFGLGVVFTIIGIFVTKEHTDVLYKAIRICLECIGIG